MGFEIGQLNKSKTDLVKSLCGMYCTDVPINCIFMNAHVLLHGIVLNLVP